MSNVYYQDELSYLREVGPEFARLHPDMARVLADRGADPDVERILEGVAFLTGRIRQKLDDELPELTASMMSLLWPHYLRPVPSMTIMEFLPEIEAMQGPVHVPAGAEFASIPVDGTRCRYRSSWPTTLRPWVIRDVKLETAEARPVRLLITLQASAKAKFEKMDLGSVRFHLAGETATAFALYLLLGAHVRDVKVTAGGGDQRGQEFTLPPQNVATAGLDRSEGVLPYPDHCFPGYRLLQEYLAFRERFLFVDIRGLDRAAAALQLTNTLEVAITFDRRLETFPLISRDNVRLHCVPAVNLFEHPADPVRLRQDRTEYLLMPDKSGAADRTHMEVYSVDSVRGLIREGGSQRREYLPFYSFAHETSQGLAGLDVGPYYQTRVVPNVLGRGPRQGLDVYLAFVSGGGTQTLPDDETISVELTCTNRHLPAELRAGDIADPTDRSPTNAKFRNILKPTPSVCPPVGKQLQWRLISHLCLNYVSLTSAQRLSELLRVYDFQSEYDSQAALTRQRMLEGLLSVRSSFSERVFRGAPLRGTHVEMELNEDHFAGEGDAYLFARIMDRFFGLYATLNGYTELSVRFARSGREQVFPPRWGEQTSPAETRN